VCKILNYSPQKMKENMDALLGKNGSNSSLHPDIATGTKTAKTVEEDLIKVLLGKADDKDPAGVLGYFHLDKRQDNLKKNEHEELLQMVSDLKAKISRNDPADDKAELEKELSGLEAQRLKVRDQIQEFTKSKEKIARFLKNNCSDLGLYK